MGKIIRPIAEPPAAHLEESDHKIDQVPRGSVRAGEAEGTVDGRLFQDDSGEGAEDETHGDGDDESPADACIAATCRQSANTNTLKQNTLFARANVR